MVTKCSSLLTKAKIKKKKQRIISFSSKVDIIKRFKSGNLTLDIANHYYLTPTAI